MKRAAIIVVGLLLAAAGAIHAQVPGQGRPQGPPQGPGGEVRGSVVDADAGEPLYGASVAVRSQADSSLVSGAIAGRDGSFQVQGLPPGPYYLQITSVGYAAKTADFTVAPGSPHADVGVVRLVPTPLEQEAIGVTVQRPTMTIEPDRNSYRARDIAPAATTATDVLEATPSVQVDTDGRISLRGNENVAIQINGRPAPIRGSQLTNYLRQLPANAIDRVEVVPTPSARYDPEGMAGIINIVTKQNTDLGISGGFTVSASTNDRYNVSGNVGYQRGPVTTFTSYGYNSDDRNMFGINDRERLRFPRSFTEQDISGDTGFGGHNLTATVDYRLGERDVLSNALTVNRRNFEETSLSLYTERNEDRETTAEYERIRDVNNDNLLLDYTLALKRTYEPQRHELSTELRFNRSKDDDHTLLWREPARGNARTELESNGTDATTRQLTGQLDYTRSLASGIKVETGYKGQARWLDREFLSLEDALGTGRWIESGLSNTFEFDEQVHAVYGVLSRGVGKFELQGGLRAERASQDFSLTSTSESFPNDYTSLFPSGVVLYNLNEGSQAKISYSRRIRRPGTQELNPFPVFFDPQNVFIGNPELKPEYTHAIELGYTRSGEWGQFQLSPFYRRTTDIIRTIVDTDDVIDGREVTSVSFDNLETSDSWGTDVNGSYRRGPFNGFASFNVFKIVTDGGSESTLATNAVNWSTRLNGTFNLTPTLALQGMWFYRGPMEMERGKFSSFQMTGLSLRQRFMDDKATLTLRVTDPFEKMGFRVEAGDENIFQITERRFNARALQLTFQYTFGQAPRVRQRPQDQPQEPQQPGFPQ